MDKKKELTAELGQQISETIKKCYGCGRCTSGCPVAKAMDFPPHLIVRWLLAGKIEKILKSKTIWICSSCQVCYSRCPFEIDIPQVIDCLKEYAQANKLTKAEPATRLFHQIFLIQIKLFGRIHEASFIGAWKAFSGNWFSDLGLGAKMFAKGKLSLKPEKIKNPKELKKLFNSEERKSE